MKLSEHFHDYEFACHCGCGFASPVPELVQVLEQIRDAIRRPIHVNSGCRCATHNQSIGGSLNSLHTQGKAADIPTDDKRHKFDLVAAAIQCGASDIGVYDWGVHVGVGSSTGLWRGK